MYINRHIVHKLPRQGTLESPLQTDGRCVAVGQSPSALHSHSTRHGLPEERRRYAIEERDSSWRMEAEPRISETDLGAVREGRSGSVCDSGEHALPAVLFSVTLSPGQGHTYNSVTESPSVCITPAEDFATSVTQNQRGEGPGDSNRSILAKQTIVPLPAGDTVSPWQILSQEDQWALSW